MISGRVLGAVFAAAVVSAATAAFVHRDLLAAALRSNPEAGSAESAQAGRALYERHCVACHGAGARGDGPAAGALPVPPDDLTALPAPPIYPDGLIWHRILRGVGGMPAYSGLLSEEEAWHLVTHLRSLSGPP